MRGRVRRRGGPIPVSTAVTSASATQSIPPERQPRSGENAEMPVGRTGSPTGSSISGVTPRRASSGLPTRSHTDHSGARQVFATNSVSWPWPVPATRGRMKSVMIAGSPADAGFAWCL